MICCHLGSVLECSHWFYGFRSKGTQTEGDVELYHCKNIQQFLASVLLWAALLNLINYSQMTANSSQIAYLSASLLDTSPASHPFSAQCTSTSFQSLFCLRKHSIFPDLLAVLRNLQFYYSFKAVYVLLTLQQIQCLTVRLFFMHIWTSLYDNM